MNTLTCANRGADKTSPSSETHRRQTTRELIIYGCGTIIRLWEMMHFYSNTEKFLGPVKHEHISGLLLTTPMG